MKKQNFTLNFNAPAQPASDLLQITTGDFLAGGGGVTHAMEQIPGVNTKWVLNHDPVAIKTNIFHHQHVQHFWADLYKQDEYSLAKVDFAWASIDCKEHTPAKGSKKKKAVVYTLGFELIRYIKHLRPYILGIENVPGFKKMAPLRICEDKANSTATYSALCLVDGKYEVEPDTNKKGEAFEKWKQSIIDLGYHYHEKIINAADHGIPTRRTRFFCFFTHKSLNMQINWAPQTHAKGGTGGFKKWVACKDYINLKNEGQSIFGRNYNKNIPVNQRFPLSVNTLKRIAGGIKKFNPDLYMLMQYYGSGINCQNLTEPLNTVRTKDCHALITVEKLKFIQDYCHSDNYNLVTEPMTPQLTRQTKQKISVEFLANATYGTVDKTQSTNEPISTITSQQRHQFISVQNNSNGKPGTNNVSIDDPIWALTAKEKMQFISLYFNSGAITSGTNKSALITAIKNGWFDFDIKMRFLEPEELAQISTFPKGYFAAAELRLSKKEATRLIGNAVPPLWAKIIIEPVVKQLREKLIELKLKAA